MNCKICGKPLTHMEGNYYFAHRHNDINPDYLKLGEIAKQTVIQTMQEGEKQHGPDEWKDKSILYHKTHALEHAELAYPGYNNDEDHIAHCMARCAMIKFLEDEKK